MCEKNESNRATSNITCNFFGDVKIARGEWIKCGLDMKDAVRDLQGPRYGNGDILKFKLTDGEPVEAVALGRDGDATLFIFVDCLKDEYPLCQDGDYSGGYETCSLRKKLNTGILGRFPEAIREHLVPFESGDLLRIPTEREIFGENPYGAFEDEGVKQFELMKLRRNRIAFQGLNGGPEWYWLQNPVRGVRSATLACFVLTIGYAANASASASHGVRPLFKYR